MKQRIPTLLLLACAAITTNASAQLWVESRTATDLTFAFRGVNSPGVLTAENQGAGARVHFGFDAAAQSVRVDITNLSGGIRTVGAPDALEAVQFGTGTLMGFGFETAPDNLLATAFAAWSNAALNLPGVAGADFISFHLDQDYTLNGGGPANPFYMDVGTSYTGNVHAGLAAGHGASFLFTFDTPAFDATVFNPLDFFFLDPDPDLFDMAFRFQQTSGLGNDLCSSENGSDKVALVFNLEEDYQVPEPSTYGLLGAAALLALACRRRFRRQPA